MGAAGQGGTGLSAMGNTGAPVRNMAADAMAGTVPTSSMANVGMSGSPVGSNQFMQQPGSIMDYVYRGPSAMGYGKLSQAFGPNGDGRK